MRRTFLILTAGCLLGAACTGASDDAEELRQIAETSRTEPRTFMFVEASEERSYEIRGELDDDLRYRMTLTFEGEGLLEQVVSDDALAVRLLDPERAGAIANTLGHPSVDAALREGRWVIDPSGAPPLLRTDIGVEQELEDPFLEALGSLQFVTRAMSDARQVTEFTLENIEYRPSLDPWVYPDTEAGEVRYDLLRPILPKREDQLQAGQGDVGVGHFRKLSVFAREERIMRVCSLVDIEGHEDFVEARGRGETDSFLIQLERRVLEGDTPTPVREREVLATFSYTDAVEVSLPSEAHTGKLEDFTAALRQAFRGGFLRSEAVDELTACDRGPEETGSG